MATKAGVGVSSEPNPKKAAMEAVQEAFKQAGTDKCNFVFLFATVGYNQEEILKEVRAATGNIPLSGCSGEGVITQEGPNEKTYGVGVMVVSSDELIFSNYLAENLKENSRQAGETIGRAITGSKLDNPLALMLLPDGLTCNMAQIFGGIESTYKKPIPFIGGTSGDNWKFVKTYQYHNDRVLSDAMSCVLISGKGSIENGVSHGCIPIGIEKTITKAKGNRIYEIDNRPAYQVLTEYLAPGEAEDFAKAMAYFSIAISEPVSKEVAEIYGKYIIRAPMSRDEKDDSITIPTEMSVGAKVQIMRRDPELVIQKAGEIAERIKKRLKGNRPKFILHFDCAGRGKKLFGLETEVKKPIEAMQNVLGKNIPWLGLFTYGEIAPVNKKNYLHNYTVVLCVVY